MSGFHHDYLGKLEKSGLVQLANIKQGLHGVYMADVIINGMVFERKTFFPQLWTLENVSWKIFESLQNIEKIEFYSNGKWCRLWGETVEKIKIETIYNMEKKKIKTSYPIGIM